MAKSKDDMKHATAQAKLSEDESLRVRYKHGTPLEGGKIAESSPVDLFSAAHHINSDHPSHSSASASSGKTATNAGSTSSTTTASSSSSAA
ncbi:hypothetical protein DITRI_Ditri04bG0205200 [Diplodiscus trichospermus]